MNTPATVRPGARRREPSDSFAGNGPLSPTENKTFRSDPSASTPPSALLRRRTDLLDESQEKEDARTSRDNNSPFSSLRAGPVSAGVNPSSASPWSTGPQSAFGAMGAFSTDPGDGGAPAQRPTFGGTRSGSRFKDILSAKPIEETAPSIKEKTSFTGLEKLSEEDDPVIIKTGDQLKTRPSRSETNPYDDVANMPRTGSAALSSHDEPGVEQMGFSAYNPAQTPHNRLVHDPTSPTNTNPYQSPQGSRMNDDDPSEGQSLMNPYARRDVFSGGHDRGSNSFGSIRGMGNMPGLGGVPGWGNPGFGTGTPGRERPPMATAFGDSVFSPLADTRSPGAFGGNNFFGGGTPFGAPPRPNQLSSIFPPVMQEQTRSDSRNDAFGGRSDPFEPHRQDSFRGGFDDGSGLSQDAFGQIPNNRPPSGALRPASQEGSNRSSPNEGMPTAQQRQMVMPDRMRWVYRDPRGNVQGPWSGLEMHDWFKAGFFTAELQVKKVEDAEYEPLAQLVRRIGNSREPFLVPQIGVPHGPGQGSQTNPWSAGAPGPSSAQPPFASSFPSFGTTLTADQQNALERRKQEEQFLMARQKEFLQQRQVGMYGPNGPGPAHSHTMHNLVHHGSAHSLHSQPSFGSITSPAGYQSSPMQTPIGQPPQHAATFQGMAPTSNIPQSARDEELQAQFGRMGFEGRGPYNQNPMNQQSFAAHERNRLSMENQQAQMQAHENTFLGQDGRNERLQEFQGLRQDMADELEEEKLPQPIGSQRPVDESVAAVKQSPAPIGLLASKKPVTETEPLSLAQQVQRTAAANKHAAEAPVDVPPVSISPLPAPAAQRTRPPVAEQLAAESRSAAGTPIETPSASIAPWADKNTEVSKGPSLKEIQEAEARRAAEQEAIMAEARRAQAEQERLAAAQVVPPAPGLPSTSTWASSGSPGTPTTPGGSVWAKPAVAKPTAGMPAKKTLAQIQKEEEARKQKAAAQAAAQTQAQAYTNPTVPVGNRYAQMASKVTASPQAGPTPVHAHSQSAGSGAWTTVGASGKPKTPATVVAAPPPGQRVVSNTTMGAPAVRPTPSRSGSLVVANTAKDKAKDELIKWCKTQLGKGGLHSGINVDDFVRQLFDFPPEAELLSEAVYGSSETLDGRRFAEEFIRRRKLAERGIVEAADTPKAISTGEKSGGWNEVAKKGPTKEPENTGINSAGFKVVSKKKGKR